MQGFLEFDREYVLHPGVNKMKDCYSSTLRCYQRQGIEKLKFFDGKAIQADDMGLGKTLQILAYVYETRKENLPCLIVCPSSLIYNWISEIKKWLDCDDVYIIKSTMGGLLFAQEALKHSFIISSYDTILHWVKPLTEYFQLSLVVFDEAHALKENPDATINDIKVVAGFRIKGNMRVTAAHYLSMYTPRKIFATGTPLSGSVMDIFNFLHWIDDGGNFYWRSHFGEEFAFEEWNPFKREVEYKGGRNLLKLNKILMNSYMIRRTKKDVLPELPKKNRVFLPIVADSHCIEKYLRVKEQGWSAGTGEIPCSVRMEMRKQLIPSIVKNAIDFIETYIQSGKKIVVYAVFHETIDRLMSHFGNIAVRYDGRMSSKEKFKAEKSFQTDPKIKIFIGNVLAAGKGITLTAADTAITLEYTDNPTDLTQTEDRINRITQKSDTTTNYYMHCLDTIDDDMVANMNKKMQIITPVVDGYEATETDLFNVDEIRPENRKDEGTLKGMMIYALQFVLFNSVLVFPAVIAAFIGKSPEFYHFLDKLLKGRIGEGYEQR